MGRQGCAGREHHCLPYSDHWCFPWTGALPPDTPEQHHPKTPFFLPGGPGDLFKLVIHWIFIYKKWKCAIRVPGPKFCRITWICLDMQVWMLSVNKDLPYPGNELPSKQRNTLTCFSRFWFQSSLVKSFSMSGKRRNAVWILINSQNSNRYQRWEGHIFKINIYSPSRMTVNPYISFWGWSPESTHHLPTHKIKPGPSPSLLLTIQDLTKGTWPQTASSDIANFAIQPLTHSKHRNELQNTPSWAQHHIFCIFYLPSLFPYTINSPGGY